MKYIVFICGFLVLPFCALAQPCSTGDGTNCLCENGDLECDLLPDITISWYALENYQSGPTEYSQSGNGANNGRLRLTGSTPNIGYGSFTVRGTDYYLCGTDTIYDPTGNPTCLDGSDPTNFLEQRIYHRDSLGNITYWDRWAGSQTYHPTHGHNHVDDWVTFTLRIPDSTQPDTLQWQIIGDGAKVGFCLMDFGSCNYYNGHCRDNQSYNSGVILNSTNIPNYGFGGGSYNCSPVEQGISVGFTDIYSENLDGMWINIPPGTCNGDYWIIAEVDHRNNFLESDETNNWTAIPYTLTLQEDSGTTSVSILGSSTICTGEQVELKASAANTYLWSTGDTTQSILIDSAGYYTVTSDGNCGVSTSDTITIMSVNSALPVTTGDQHCGPGILNLTGNGSGNLYWFNSLLSDSVIHNGTTFTTPLLQQSQAYYVANESVVSYSEVYSPPHGNTIGSGSYYTGTQWLIFDVNEDMILKSVKVYANGAGNRTLQILDNLGAQVKNETFNLPDGESRITLNWLLNQGTDYTFRIVGTPNLFRNNGGVNYPYSDSNNLVSIKNSSAGANYYYFFYDWEVKAPDLNCLSEKIQVNATINDHPVINTINVSPAVCLQNTGTIFINQITGNPPYTYNWSNGQTTQTATELASGIYILTVSDVNSCIDTDTILVGQVADVSYTSSKRNVSCDGNSDGNISIVLFGNSAPYSVQWNTNPVQTTATINNLSGGYYTATITDINACTKDVTIEVREPVPMSLFAIPNNSSQPGLNDGDINLLVSGGVAPYTYQWNTGAITEDIAGVGAGTYYVTVVDRNGCAEFSVINLQ